MVYFYLFVLVLAQSGEAHWTVATPWPTQAACEDAKRQVDERLTAEQAQPAPNNAAVFRTFCASVDFAALPRKNAA